MKRIVVFLLSLLLLGVVLIPGTGNIAFADHASHHSQVAVLICSPVTTTPPPTITFPVTAFSNTTTVSITVGEDCGTALAALQNAGLVIKNIKVLDTSTPSVVYTLMNGGF
jgi:hypothetical protein